MKVIIAGSRDLNKDFMVRDAIEASGFRITEVVCGMARGVDMVGHAWAKRNLVPVKEFYAQWKLLGRSAGYKRNVEMAMYADALIAVWDGSSRGTQHMINVAKEHGLDVFIYVPRKMEVVVRVYDQDNSLVVEFSKVGYYDMDGMDEMIEIFKKSTSVICGGAVEVRIGEVE